MKHLQQWPAVVHVVVSCLLLSLFHVSLSVNIFASHPFLSCLSTLEIMHGQIKPVRFVTLDSQSV